MPHPSLLDSVPTNPIKWTLTLLAPEPGSLYPHLALASSMTQPMFLESPSFSLRSLERSTRPARVARRPSRVFRLTVVS